MTIRNLLPPDDAMPNPAWQRLISVRRFYEQPTLQVCTHCRWSEKAQMQIRCPRCLNMLVVAKELR